MSDMSKQGVIDLFGGTMHDTSRLLYPETTESVESRVITAFTRLKSLGNVALVDGAFDVPHDNHEWYLRHCKFLGVQAALLAQYDANLTASQLQTLLQTDPSASQVANLAVTVDADSKIAAKKSGLAHKGGVPRPIYPWEARASRLAGYHYQLAGKLRQTVDLVTVEGDPLHVGTPLESSLTLADFLNRQGLLDTFIVFGEHSRTVDEARELGLNPAVIDDQTGYAVNPQTGQPYGSSEIIARAQGQPVANPITRPVGL